MGSPPAAPASPSSPKRPTPREQTVEEEIASESGVERIETAELRDGEWHYLIKWRDCDESLNS